jgi:uncharacterized protein (TIGR00290 family)
MLFPFRACRALLNFEMRYALSFSGGKDSTLALDRSRRQGLDVAYLFTIYEGVTERVRFHGVRRELIEAQAKALDIPIILRPTYPKERNYEAVFFEVLDELKSWGVNGIIFGNIHLADIRSWYEERTRSHGFVHVEPLWGEAPQTLVREVVARGYQARIVSIDLSRGQRCWLGRYLDMYMIDELCAAADVDPCGERGEYHTFVEDGPLFRYPVTVIPGQEIEMEGHGLLELSLAGNG